VIDVVFLSGGAIEVVEGLRGLRGPHGVSAAQQLYGIGSIVAPTAQALDDYLVSRPRDADSIGFDDALTGLGVSDVQGAIQELYLRLFASNVDFTLSRNAAIAALLVSLSQ
jgi:hypothetical protein